MIAMSTIVIAATAAAAQTTSSTTTTTTTTTLPQLITNPNTGLALTGRGAAIFVVIAVGILALLWFVPVLINVRAARSLQRGQQAVLGQVLEDFAKDEHTAAEVAIFVSSMTELLNSQARQIQETNPNAQGLTSSLLALLTLSLIGFALAVVLVSSSTDAGDLRKTIITSLLSILATIGGFYFGARTAQVSAQQQATRSNPGTDGSTTSPGRPGSRPPGANDAAALSTDPKNATAATSPTPEESQVGPASPEGAEPQSVGQPSVGTAPGESVADQDKT